MRGASATRACLPLAGYACMKYDVAYKEVTPSDRNPGAQPTQVFTLRVALGGER